MALSAEHVGKPKTVNTYEDENENGIIARIGAVVHGSTLGLARWSFGQNNAVSQPRGGGATSARGGGRW